MEEILVKHHPLKHLSNMPHVDEKGISGISCNIIGEWTEILAYRASKNISAGDAMEFYQYMMSHSILDLLDIENTEKK